MVVNKSSNLLALKYDMLLRKSDPFFPNNGPNVYDLSSSHRTITLFLSRRRSSGRYVRFAIYQCKSISSFFLCVLGYQLPNEEGWYLHKLEFTSIPTWHCKTEEREKPLRDSHD